MPNVSPNLDWDLARTKWAATLNPVLANPVVGGSVLTGVKLVTGTNTINHRLGQKLQGWLVVGQNAAAAIYDQQATNQYPQLTLVLNASAPVTVNLYVF